MPKVYIVNRSGHDYGDAYRFGDKLIYLSEGQMPRYQLNSMYRQFVERMKDSTEDDYLLPSSLNNMNIVATAIWLSKHKKINLLLWQKGKYLEQTLSMEGETSDEH